MVRRKQSGTMMHKSLIAAAVAALLTLTGVARAADDPILSAFVVLGDGGQAQARVITTADACPSATVDGQSLAMSQRAAPETLPLRPTRSSPAESKPSAFPDRVCEATLPAGAKRAAVGGHRLPLPVAQPKRIVVIGDTGCRIKTSDKAYQACNDIHRYPFSRVAAAAAAFKPDLVLHVGDYLYRENACPADQDGCAGSPWGYGWDAWSADFFAPGQVLLSAAPWVAVRGNHENCNRAGQGWWRFLEPRPLVAGRDCIDAANDGVGDYDDPYAAPLGDGAQIIVLDSSNTGNKPFDPASHEAVQYRDMYAKFAALAARAPYSIMVEHHPILGFAATQKGDKVVLNPGNAGIQSVFGAVNAGLVPANVQLLLAGHVHVWEQVSFSSPHPTQIIAGFSGTQEDIVPLPRTLPADAVVAPGAVVEAFSSWVDGFGFMTLERAGPDRWTAQVRDINGKIVNRCTITGRKSACETPQVLEPKAR
jgi:hypothetical protein